MTPRSSAAAATLQAAAEVPAPHRRAAPPRPQPEPRGAGRGPDEPQGQQARLALTLDATNDGLWDFDLTSGGVYFSPVWARLLGYAPEELAQRVETFWAHVHPDDAARVQSVQDQHLSGRLPTKELEVRLRMKTGEYRWFLDQGKVVDRAADGTPLRMLGTISDITDRKRMLEDLHESETRFRALFDKSPVIVTLVDMAASRVAEMNEVGLRTFGYTRDEVLGRTTLELGFWVDDQARRAAARQLIATGLVSGVELQLAPAQERRGLLGAPEAVRS
jgi:PAS domain S-box-containing protein